MQGWSHSSGMKNLPASSLGCLDIKGENRIVTQTMGTLTTGGPYWVTGTFRQYPEHRRKSLHEEELMGLVERGTYPVSSSTCKFRETAAFLRPDLHFP